MPSHEAYEKNKEHIKAYNAKYKAEHPEWYRAYQKKYSDNNREKIKERQRTSYRKNIQRHRAQSREFHKKQRLLVFSHYGLFCACCKEDTYEFLSLDHINGGGNAHRRRRKAPLYTWIIRNKFPTGYQTLCHNCNMAKGFYGQCPHNKNVQSLLVP